MSATEAAPGTEEELEVLAEEEFRTRRLAEFVYGIISALIAVAGLFQVADEAHPLQVTGAIIGSAVAIWLAHAYSHLIGRRVRSRRVFDWSDAAHELRASWPIVTAGAIVAIPVFLATFGVWSLSTALVLGDVVALAFLALLGYLAGRWSEAGALHTLSLVVATVSIGLLVVLIELGMHFL